MNGTSSAVLTAETAPRRHGIAVASRASVPERGAMWRLLRSQGWPILSTWIDEDGEGETIDFEDLWMRCEREIGEARALVFYAETSDFPLKGALVEAGLAIGMGKPVYVVIPGLLLDVRSKRPLGSWIAHPLVGLCASVEEAFLRALHPNLQLPDLAATRMRAELAYHDPSYPLRRCERDGCGRHFTGPAVYCSLKCAMEDA